MNAVLESSRWSQGVVYATFDTIFQMKCKIIFIASSKKPTGTLLSDIVEPFGLPKVLNAWNPIPQYFGNDFM